MKATIGVDLGGTKIAAGLVAQDGELLHTASRATPSGDGAVAVVRAAGMLAADIAAWAGGEGVEVGGCGAGVAGIIDPDGVVTHATGSLPGWAGTDVAAGLAEMVDMPVHVINDVHAMAFGEHRFGAAAGFGEALVMAVGTGIGGALIQDGQVVSGRTGTAGAIGHLPAPRPDPRPCPCGRVGHVEAYSSGPAVVARYVEQGGDATRLEEVAARAHQGDELAHDVIDQAAETLGRVLGGVANLLDIEIIVVGGGVAALGELLLTPLRRGFDIEALPGPDTAPIEPAALGPWGAVVGAATAASETSH